MSTAYDEPLMASVLGGDAPVNAGADNPADIRSNNSPTLVRNPLRAANVVISNRVDTPRFSCVLNASFDRGSTWTQTPVPLPASEEPKCFAPDAAFPSDGTPYLSFVTLNGRGNTPNALWTASSGDRGRARSKPVRVAGPLRFQVQLAVAPTNPRRIYLTWLRAADVGFLSFPRMGNPIESIRSDDGGATWQRPVPVSNSARERVIAPVPAFGSKGEQYVLYLIRPIQRFAAHFPPHPALAVDRSNGRVYAAFHDARLGDADVLLWSLPAGGETWSGPTRVNETATRDGTWQYLPQLAVAPDGRVDGVYYDRRSDTRNVPNHVSLQSSVDAAASFLHSIRLSSKPLDSWIGFGGKNGLPDLGSRLALIYDTRRSPAVWTDTRAGTRASNKQDIARAVVAFAEPTRRSNAAKYGLRFGAVALAILALSVLGSALVERRR